VGELTRNWLGKLDEDEDEDLQFGKWRRPPRDRNSGGIFRTRLCSVGHENQNARSPLGAGDGVRSKNATLMVITIPIRRPSRPISAESQHNHGAPILKHLFKLE
jgi:hypothetical protein